MLYTRLRLGSPSTYMECAPLEAKPSTLKRKFEQNKQEEEARYKSKDELELWLHSAGILHSGRIEMLKNFELNAKNTATEKQREAFDIVNNQLMLNPSCALNHVCKIAACVIRKLQETNQLSLVPGLNNANNKPAKVAKKTPTSK